MEAADGGVSSLAGGSLCGGGMDADALAPPVGSTAAPTPEPPNHAEVSTSGLPPMHSILELASVILPERLYFTSLSYHPSSNEAARFFTIDYDLAYEPYFADFGPLNLSMLVRFCRALRDRLRATPDGTRVIFYSAHNPHLRANAAYLISGFATLVLRMAPADVIAAINTGYPPLLPFRDASYGVAAFQLTVPDVVEGLHKAVSLGWLDVDSFDAEAYEHNDQLQNGDWNWIVPQRFVAFSSPLDDVPGREAKRVAPVFRNNSVTTVVRLNERRYDPRAFIESGLRHEDLSFPDGSTPPDIIVKKFLTLCETQKGTIAVHCKAGLGRTGTLLCLCLMKHYGFTALQAIAWCRVCRPGSVIGCQQPYLVQMERRMSIEGEQYRKQLDEAPPVSPLSGGTTMASSRTVPTKSAATMGGTRMNSTTASNPQQQPQRQGASPAQRARPTPLCFVERMPYLPAQTDNAQRLVRLQTLLVEGTAAAREAPEAAAVARRLASGKPLRPGEPTKAPAPSKITASTSGIVRPVLPAIASTFVAGVTDDTLDDGFSKALGQQQQQQQQQQR